jgi:hypothetical protein
MDAEEVADLVRQLAEEQRRATLLEVAQIRAVYAERGLPQSVTQRVQQKYEQHVERRAEWPSDTSPEEYLESLRSTVTDARTAIYTTFEIELDEWVVYFVGRVRREWCGTRSGARIVVLFRRKPQRWITGFQARDGDDYVANQGGYWMFHPR